MTWKELVDRVADTAKELDIDLDKVEIDYIDITGYDDVRIDFDQSSGKWELIIS